VAIKMLFLIVYCSYVRPNYTDVYKNIIV